MIIPRGAYPNKIEANLNNIETNPNENGACPNEIEANLNKKGIDPCSFEFAK